MIQLLIFLSNTGATNKQQFCIFFSKDINHRHHHRPNHHHIHLLMSMMFILLMLFYNGDNDVCRDSHNMNNNAHANNYYDN